MPAFRGPASALAAAALLGACARNPSPATAPRAAPAPAAAPLPAPVPLPDPVADLSGEWQFAVEVGGTSATGTLDLARAGGTYSGTARADDGEVYPMISLNQAGAKIVMMFETPSGAARVECALAGLSELNGTLLMGDAVGTFHARRK
jgi:hypothetical protein